MSVPITLIMALQVAQAGVAGTVRDDLTGEPLPGAVVTLPDIDRATITDALGRFSFEGLTPGPHHLTILGEGFKPRTMHALVPRGGQVRLNVALSP